MMLPRTIYCVVRSSIVFFHTYHLSSMSLAMHDWPEISMAGVTFSILGISLMTSSLQSRAAYPDMKMRIAMISLFKERKYFYFSNYSCREMSDKATKKYVEDIYLDNFYCRSFLE